MQVRSFSSIAVRLASCTVALGLGLGFLASTTGCKPLYSGKAEKLKSPSKKKAPPTTEEKIVWNEDAKVDFQGDASKVRRRAAEAAPLSREGMDALAAADRAPTPAAKGSLVVQALSKFGNALAKDPYSAEATEGMASAYARVLYKGRALAFLKRLAQLEAYPDFSADARRMIGIALTDSAFDGFRAEADAAVGR